MLISNFELFVKPPRSEELDLLALPEFEKPNFPVTQGYFLAINNTISSEVIVSSIFTVVTQSVDIDQIFSFTKATGQAHLKTS